MSAADTPGLNEFERIARYFRPLAAGFPGALALADDAALLTVPPGHELVATTDTLLEGVHFQSSDPPESVAARLMRRNLSDLGAMGAAPYAYTLVTAVPASCGEAWLKAFAEELGREQTRYAIHLAGGDSARSPGPIMLVVAAFGHAPQGEALRRAAPADAAELDAYVSGTIGDSWLGLQYLLGKGQALPQDEASRDFLIGRHYRPEPRLALGAALRGLARAAIDVSDGLLADAAHVALASQMEIDIELAHVPLSAAARSLLASSPALIENFVTGGEDYELFFLARRADADRIAALSARLNLPLTRIGAARKSHGACVRAINPDGTEMAVNQMGWRHF